MSENLSKIVKNERSFFIIERKFVTELKNLEKFMKTRVNQKKIFNIEERIELRLEME